MRLRTPDERFFQRVRHHAAASLRLYPTVLRELDLFHGSEVAGVSIMVIVYMVLGKLVLVSAA